MSTNEVRIAIALMQKLGIQPGQPIKFSAMETWDGLRDAELYSWTELPTGKFCVAWKRVSDPFRIEGATLEGK